jgi:hypothetical protein
MRRIQEDEVRVQGAQRAPRQGRCGLAIDRQAATHIAQELQLSELGVSQPGPCPIVKHPHELDGGYAEPVNSGAQVQSRGREQSSRHTDEDQCR